MHKQQVISKQTYTRHQSQKLGSTSRIYTSQLILLITNLVANFKSDVTTLSSFAEAKTNINQDLKVTCRKSFQKLEKKSKKLSSAESVLASLHFIMFLPLSLTTQKMKLLCRNIIRNKTIILLCFVYLNVHNWKYLRVANSTTDDRLKSRRDILKNFIHHHCKDNSLTIEQLQFFMECASQLDARSLTRQLSSKIIALEPNFATVENDFIFNQTIFKNQHDSLYEADGVIYERLRDPPGQKCVYILPGDPSKELYRLGTFIQFPAEVPVHPKHLAAAGFYYTGYKDRVKCFSCGLCVEKWAFGDDVKAARWHQGDCKTISNNKNCKNVTNTAAMFMSSQILTKNFDYRKTSNQNYFPPIASSSSQPSTSSSTNEDIAVSLSHRITNPKNSNISVNEVRHSTSLSSSSNELGYQKVQLAKIFSVHHEQLLKTLDLRRESERLKTFDSWKPRPLTIFPIDLAKSGFIYLGDSDRVQCFSCGGVLKRWRIEDNVEQEHKRAFPLCKMVLCKEEHNIPLSNAEREKEKRKYNSEESSTLSEHEQNELKRMFPCRYPVSLHMQNMEARLNTFDYRWPSRQVRATPREIAEAGFYFLGERDRVKCWYCNGGLQNWDPEDIPWKEHAKWFPTCEFLLQKKGPDFVHQIVAIFPDLRRPILRSQYDVPYENSRSQSSSQRASSPAPVFIDPKIQRKKIKKQVEENMNTSMVKTVAQMGFETLHIRKLIKRRLQEGSTMYVTESDLIEDLTIADSNSLMSDTDSNSSDPESHQIVQSPTEFTPNAENATELTAQGQEQLQRLENERRCKVCLDGPADVVFVPCSHLCSCTVCAQALRNCPICRKKIEKAIRTYSV